MAKATELKDLDVDRVDAVDKPATGRNFLLFKSEDGAPVMKDGTAILKGYGMVATAAAAVITKMRTDKNAVVSRKSAIALNGLAQVLGQDPVFVGKSVPTQPYQFSEPDGDKRGPADEDLGGNFTPRSMPGSMVGSVQFRMKDEDEADDDRKVKAAKEDAKDDDDDEDDRKSKTAKSLKALKAMYDEEDDDRKRKAIKAAMGALKAAKDDDDDDDMDASERANRGVARKGADFEKAVADAVAKSLISMGLVEKVTKSEEDEAEPVKKVVKSRQIADDEPTRVRKSGGYEPRFGVSFANVAFQHEKSR